MSPLSVEQDHLLFTAYDVAIASEPAQELRAGGAKREWIDATPEHFVYRCLPLKMANQMGWDILSPVDFSVMWEGGDKKKNVRITFPDKPTEMVASHFGYGTLTFRFGYLFRTPKGHNLWVKGPPNQPKDGIAPLEGIVEADWGHYTFTMNWKFTRPNVEVFFKKDESVCRIIPFPRDYLARFVPEIIPISANPELEKNYLEWNEDRQQFNKDLKFSITDAAQQKWMKSYFLGKTHQGEPAPEHETKVRLREFERRDRE